MRNAIRVLSLTILFAPLALAQSKKIEATDLLHHPFQVDFPSGSQLSIHVRSGDVRILGRDDKKISVRVDARNPEKAKDIKVRFERSDASTELNISGGPKNDVELTIEVPRATGLFVRMSAGQLEVNDVVGDKDVQLHAGELIIGLGNPEDYSHLEASITTGGLEAEPFGESHGGLFRSFQKNGHGKYKLHAHVGAGDLTLK
jgi:hypothetical protein